MSQSAAETYSVGPGVAQKMIDHGDEPRSDEMYFAPGVSQTVGRDALYYYISADNVTQRCPFE